MARKATNQVTTIGIDIGKISFHLISPNVACGSKPVLRRHYQEGLFLMQWTAPTTGIAMCQSAVAI